MRTFIIALAIGAFAALAFIVINGTQSQDCETLYELSLIHI